MAIEEAQKISGPECRTDLDILYDRASAFATLANRVELTQRYEGKNGLSTPTLLVLKEPTFSERLKLKSSAEFLDWPLRRTKIIIQANLLSFKSSERIP
jgi:hypothetical protein